MGEFFQNKDGFGLGMDFLDQWPRMVLGNMDDLLKNR
jgi:hypothetical protein